MDLYKNAVAIQSEERMSGGQVSGWMGTTSDYIDDAQPTFIGIRSLSQHRRLAMEILQLVTLIL